MATPNALPSWRAVLVTAAATPECERGIPEMAVLLMGGLTTPKPSPRSR